MSDMKNPYLILNSAYPSFHKVEKKIADYILENGNKIPSMTVCFLAKQIDVAESSIVRFCKLVGFDGFTDLKVNLATYSQAEGERQLIFQDITKTDSTSTIMQKVFAGSISCLQDTLSMLDYDKMDQAMDAIYGAEKLYFIGIGSSSTIASDAAYRYMRIGLPATAYVDPHMTKIACSLANEKTVIVAISHAGRSPEIIHAITLARANGAKIISITSFSHSPQVDLSDITLQISSTEAALLSEAISSRIAHITIIDALYSGICVKHFKRIIPYIDNFSNLMHELRL